MTTRRFVLVGAHAGKTINLGGHQFVDGVYEFAGPEPHILPSDDEAKKKAAILAKSYQAFPEGSTELKEAQARIKGGKAPPGEDTPGEREKREEQQRNEAVVTNRAQKGIIRTALGQLDPANDEHWTEGGLPSVAAVRKLASNENVSRADISALAPNLTREEAAKAKSESDPLD